MPPLPGLGLSFHTYGHKLSCSSCLSGAQHFLVWMRAGPGCELPAGRLVPVHLRWAVCLRLITGLGGVDGVFTAGLFNEIRAVLIYEKWKAPLSFSPWLASLISMYESSVPPIKKVVGISLQSVYQYLFHYNYTRGVMKEWQRWCFWHECD